MSNSSLSVSAGIQNANVTLNNEQQQRNDCDFIYNHRQLNAVNITMFYMY